MARIPSAARFYLELDGQPCGFLRSVEGGSVRGEVVAEAPGPQHFLKKHLASAAPEPIVITFGLGLAPAVYEWIAETWDGKFSARDGAIVFADAAAAKKRTIEFTRGLITAVGFPALDGSSKDAALLTVTIEPEQVAMQKGSGKLAGAAAKAKDAMVANFRVEVDGLETNHVSSVAPFTVATKTAQPAGERRVRAKGQKIDFPDLRLTLAESGAANWSAWHEDFVVKGNSDDANEKRGSLAVLGASLKKELLRVDFEGLGIYRLAPETAGAGERAVSRLRAELYCERMALSLP